MLIEHPGEDYHVEDPPPQELCKSKSIAARLSIVNSKKPAVRVVVGAGARLLFYPTLLYNVVRNRCEADFRWWDQIEQFLLLGAVPFPKDVLRLKDLGVEAVITLNESYETLVSASMYQSQRIKHLVIPTQDYLFAPSLEDIQCAVDFIHENVQHGKTTYVHCKAGRGRSTTIVLCYLVKHRGMTPVDAFNYVRSKRPRVLLAASQWEAVQRFSEFHHYESKIAFPIFSAPQHWSTLNGLPAIDGHGLEFFSQDQKRGCDELPVLVSLSDLEGYTETKDAGIVGNDMRKEIGVVYKVRIMAARSIFGVARASAALARLSCIWLGCHAGDRVFKLTLPSGALSDVDLRSSTGYQLVAPQAMVSHLDLRVCQQGLVKC